VRFHDSLLQFIRESGKSWSSEGEKFYQLSPVRETQTLMNIM